MACSINDKRGMTSLTETKTETETLWVERWVNFLVMDDKTIIDDDVRS